MTKHLPLFLCILLVSSCTDHLKEFEALPIMQTTNDRYERSGSPETNGGTTCIFTVEEQASFPGGIAAWKSHLIQYLKQPNGGCTKGKVYLAFRVKVSGEITDIKVVRGTTAAADEIAINILKASPNWIPGTRRGTPIDSNMMIMIRFGLNL